MKRARAVRWCFIGWQTTCVLTLAWSEYPSWSVFGVADKEGILDGKEGAQGTIEKKWNVDIVLNYAEYESVYFYVWCQHYRRSLHH